MSAAPDPNGQPAVLSAHPRQANTPSNVFDSGKPLGSGPSQTFAVMSTHDPSLSLDNATTRQLSIGSTKPALISRPDHAKLQVSSGSQHSEGYLIDSFQGHSNSNKTGKTLKVIRGDKCSRTPVEDVGKIALFGTIKNVSDLSSVFACAASRCNNKVIDISNKLPRVWDMYTSKSTIAKQSGPSNGIVALPNVKNGTAFSLSSNKQLELLGVSCTMIADVVV